MDLVGVNVPTEIIDQILSYNVTDLFNSQQKRRHKRGPNGLELRLVCRLFDSVVSRQALRRFAVSNILRRVYLLDRMSLPTVAWLLATKLKSCRDSKTGLAVYARTLAKAMSAWKQCNAEPTLHHDYYITAACNLLVAVKGTVWVTRQLRGSSESSNYPSPHKDQHELDALAEMGGLQVASWCGDASIVESLLTHGIDSKAFDANFGRPMFAAAYNGQKNVARLLVDAGAALNGETDGTGIQDQLQSQIHRLWPAAVAGRCKHVHTERYLLEQCIRSASPLHANWALLYACMQGIAWAVRLALERPDIDVNTVGHHTKDTPLMLAIIHEHKKVVVLLLKRQDLKPNMRNLDGTTALMFAVRWLHKKTVQRLLERDDLDLDLQDTNTDRNPLAHAVSRQADDITIMLLQRSSNLRVNSCRVLGHSLLWYAVFCSRVNIVRHLLERDDVDPNDESPTSPLIEAASVGNSKMVRLLLTRPDIDPNRKDGYGMTALNIAVQNGYNATVAELLSDVRVNPNIGASLVEAVGRGSAIAKQLLAHRDIDPNILESSGMPISDTPLTAAVRKRNKAAVEELLKHAYTDPNARNGSGWTPLTLAVQHRGETLARELLKHADVDPSAPNRDGLTPLMLAREEGLQHLVALLEKVTIEP
ncbi:ankyrin repeat-containing domain protein [Xylariaceae sp. FL1272]|nr:ankyrin repeat-containing domain protein [Xylariaceae sp. FL1272]